ncbi:outer dense fiber protein 2 isoform X9 [Taeniopygia guttata]|uniref:outer dense fiber protein 2 isoform X9 n=1 Tax=Taeniopygia guttata TaxID=59729 RepID=UPI003BB96E0D
MVEPRAARRRRRPRPCGRSSCPWCGQGAQSSAHGRPCAARRVDRDQKSLRTPRSWCISSINGERSSTPKTVCKKVKALKVAQKHKQKSKGDGVRAVRVKTKAPWIPPGKTSTRDTILKWEQESSERVEATPNGESDKMQSVLRVSDLSTDDDGPACCKINKYEKKIDSLMNMVGTLKKEVKIQQMEEQEEITKRLLEEQEEELHEVTQELVETENENTRLRRNIELMKEEKDLTALQKECLQQEKECLLSKLNEAERDGAAAARQIHALRNTIGRLNIEKHMSSTDINALTRQKELLLQKLSTFEKTNRTLRELLAELQSREKDTQKVMDRQAMLLKRLADSDAENMQLQIRLQGKEKEVETLTLQIVAEKDQAKKAFELARSLECVKAHLQAQLRSKEEENNRLAAELKSLEVSENHTKEEMDLLLEQLQDLKCKAESDKEALKKAVRAQKERAERSEEYVQKLTAQLAEKESALAEAQCNLESWKNRCNKAMKEKDDLEMEIVTLNSRVADQVEQLAKIQEQTRDENDALSDKVQKMNGENNILKRDNEKLKAALISTEDKLNQAQMELQHLQNSVRSYEGLIENYMTQAQMAQKEADEMAERLEKCEAENQAIKDKMNKAIEETRATFQQQLSELEKLPEIVKYMETQLAVCHEQLMCYEKKNTDLCAKIADLRQLGIETASVLFQFPTCLQDSVHLLIPRGSLINSCPLMVICFCSSTCCECC